MVTIIRVRKPLHLKPICFTVTSICFCLLRDIWGFFLYLSPHHAINSKSLTYLTKQSCYRLKSLTCRAKQSCNRHLITDLPDQTDTPGPPRIWTDRSPPWSTYCRGTSSLRAWSHTGNTLQPDEIYIHHTVSEQDTVHFRKVFLQQ